MNPLQKNPHLFANGKFKMKIMPSPNKGYKDEPWIETIHGTIRDKKGDWWLIPTCSDFSFSADRCTLIARPIEDMTDEEIRNINNDYPPHILRTSWEYQTEIGNLSFSTAREFLAIGVYFGPQSHFEDGTVINSRTI